MKDVRVKIIDLHRTFMGRMTIRKNLGEKVKQERSNNCSQSGALHLVSWGEKDYEKGEGSTPEELFNDMSQLAPHLQEAAFVCNNVLSNYSLQQLKANV